MPFWAETKTIIQDVYTKTEKGVKWVKGHPVLDPIVKNAIPEIPFIGKILTQWYENADGSEGERTKEVLLLLKKLNEGGEEYFTAITMEINKGYDMNLQNQQYLLDVMGKVDQLSTKVDRIDSTTIETRDNTKKLINLFEEMMKLSSTRRLLDNASMTYELPVIKRLEFVNKTDYGQIYTNNFPKITSFWNTWEAGELKEKEYVTFHGTLSKYIPMVVGHPKGKVKSHRDFRRAINEMKKEEFPLSPDVLLAITAGQMVWRRTWKDGYTRLGLYQSIVRNSIPIYVEDNYFKKEVNKIFQKPKRYVIDAEVQGKLVQIKKDYKSPFRIKAMEPEIRDDKRPTYGISVTGRDKTWIIFQEESKYLDGDIWVALDDNGKEKLISRFLDISDMEYFIEECKELRKDVNNNYPEAEIIYQFDQVEKLIDKEQLWSPKA